MEKNLCDQCENQHGPTENLCTLRQAFFMGIDKFNEQIRIECLPGGTIKNASFQFSYNFEVQQCPHYKGKFSY